MLNYFIGKKIWRFYSVQRKIFYFKKSHIEDTEKYFAENGGKQLF